ncbi:hypothetical protein SDC9_185445 [bioreactor metagenome]|uniref:Uncharacterized protein n=1 Tax=bioreactor metagenome TaxID=1076179 RepID=A0A645HP74_9ZZZZ
MLPCSLDCRFDKRRTTTDNINPVYMTEIGKVIHHSSAQTGDCAFNGIHHQWDFALVINHLTDKIHIVAVFYQFISHHGTGIT